MFFKFVDGQKPNKIAFFLNFSVNKMHLKRRVALKEEAKHSAFEEMSLCSKLYHFPYLSSTSIS